ncbi:MAG: hypothetical protein B7Y36_17350 [Novosphingobium sp. 28-62-57]|uniref:YfjI family protein n=1 Tax=Novosphingobium sp. 28-62-57 TaxID=1970409 RepID=UPI000BCBBDEC|nr:YfjI family protein [Novosphingobium sp. 28-62-57]OYZ08258.1 MAG: hypothetical protein B7Y36_17350 [Novosphingobium sp. 28-62-57]
MAARPNMQARLEQAETITPDQPQPLVREIPDGLPYPVDALGPLQSAVEAVQAMTQAPMAIPAQSALSIAALAVQGFANVETLGGDRPLSLYCLTIAESGERKTSCDEKLVQTLREYEKEQAKAYREERKAFGHEHAIWKKQYDKALTQVKTGKTGKAELAALGPEPAPPAMRDRLVSEPTYEGLTRLFAEGQPSLGLFSDEGGQFLGGYAMAKDNRQKTLTALNDLWQGNPIRRTRQGETAFVLHGRRLSLHLMAQPVVTYGLLSDPVARDSGFLPRCLICQPVSTIGTRLHRETHVDTAPLYAFGTRLADILHTGMAMDPETRELHPKTLRLSEEALALLIGFSDEVERAQAPGGAFELVRGFASKAAEQAARIAGVLSLWQDMSASEVSIGAMRCGIRLAQFYLSEALRLSGAAQVSEEVAQAEALRLWMLSTSHGKDWLQARDVVQRGPNRLREQPKAMKAIEMLTETGWLAPYKQGTVLDGSARRQAWRIIR